MPASTPRWTAWRNDNQLLHALILTLSLNWLQSVELEVQTDGCDVVQRLSSETPMGGLESKKMTEQTD